MLPEDWEAVRQIYEESIATGQATFQQQLPEWEEWNNDHLKHSRIVACENSQVLGWAALTAVFRQMCVCSSWRGKRLRKH